jgi:2',3'-cyclic-nucleotide 2'-phosphodiesterase (5'-nucleotidase family)
MLQTTMFKKLTALAVSCTMVAGLLTVTPNAAHALDEPTFYDVPKKSFAYEAAEYFFQKGTIIQEESGLLGVHEKLTRKEALRLLHSLVPVRLANKKNNLSLYAASLLRERGGENATLSREQVAKLLHFAFSFSAAKPLTFADVPSSSPFRPFIQSVAVRGLMTGNGKNNFLPKASVTRGQMLVMLHRAEMMKIPLMIMHTNDTHGNIQDFARRATAIKDVRSAHENTLLLDAGDVFSGTLYFTKYNGEKDVELMNRVGYDAMVLGNHEFDKTSAVLANFINKANFSVLSANLDFSKDKDLQPTIGKFAPYVIKNMNGYRVGIFGLTTEMFRETSSPSDDIIISSAVDSARNSIKALKAAGVDKIIALTHLGLYEDTELAKQVTDIDVIVGGHTHDKLDTPLTVNNTLIVQAGQYGQHLGTLSIAFDRHGKVITKDTVGRVIQLNPNTATDGETGEVAADPAIKTIVDAATAEINEFKKTVVGASTVDLDGVRNNVRTKETNLGNLIADSYLAFGKKLKNADLALVNGGGVRASIAKGNITLGDVLTVMPFGNTMGVLDVTGEQLLKAIENGVSRVEFNDGRFPQMAGARYTFDKTKPAMSRVVSMEVKDALGNFVAVNPQKTYRIVTNSFVMKGGDGYDIFNQASYREDLFIVDYEMFLEYLKGQNPVSPTVEGRLSEVVAP